MYGLEVTLVICAFEDSHESPTTNFNNGSYVTLLLDCTRIGFCPKVAILITTHTFKGTPQSVVSIICEEGSSKTTFPSYDVHPNYAWLVLTWSPSFGVA
jgi:hypothetical protein